ncbi:MAG: hypothetical protein CSA42_02625 [Gammaproteobacteria bacterium]|nr:MAG: hypothetical protein CSA42_02625 [Gammaproteobacteria bacterium]
MSNISKGNTALPIRLLISCVFLPVFLALVAIFTTTLPTQMQSKFFMGVPVILWFWLAVSFFVCLITIIFAVKMSRITHDLNFDKTDSERRGGSHD